MERTPRHHPEHHDEPSHHPEPPHREHVEHAPPPRRVGNTTATNQQNIHATNTDTATARTGNVTGSGIGRADTSVGPGGRRGSPRDVSVSNQGSVAGRSGDAAAVGHQGDNLTAGSVGSVAASGGGGRRVGNTTATNRQDISARNTDTATATSGNVTGSGIGRADTLVGPGGRRGGPSDVSVSNQGSADLRSGDASAVGHQGDNITTGSTGQVSASGGGREDG